MDKYIPLTTAEYWRMHDSAVPCCPDAKRVFCVCRISVECPRHGLVCAGSHD
jgi:hypothetical protein